MQRLKDRIRELGKDQNQLATFLADRLGKKVGPYRGRVSKCLNGIGKGFSHLELAPLAEFLQWDLTRLLDVLQNAQPISRGAEAVPMPIDVPKGPDSLALMEAKEMGGGYFSLSNEPIGATEMAASLVGVPSGFALYMVSDSMQPKYDVGQLLYIDPTRPAGVGDYALLKSRADENGVSKYAIRRILEVTDDHWKVKQFNPEKTQTFSKKEWASAFKVVGAREK